MNSVETRADQSLRRLDRKVGKEATYYIWNSSTVSTTTGINTADLDAVPDVILRSKELNIRELTAYAQAGITGIDAAWKIRKVYVDEPKQRDQFLLTVSGFRYEVLNARMDDIVGVDWILLTRRMRG